MQIQNNPNINSNIAVNSSQPNVGDTLLVTVKEKVNNQDAIVSMRGTTSTVQFEGNVPEQDKVYVEITGKTSEGNYTVKVSDRTSTTPSSQEIGSLNPNSQMSEVVKAFTSRGISLSKDQMASIKDFLTNENGTIEQKMDTLRIMAQKEIVISESTLKSVHEALNGKSLSASLLSVLDELGGTLSFGSNKTLDTIRAEVQREPNIEKAIQIVKDYLKNAGLNDAVVRELEKGIAEITRFVQAGQTVNARVQLIQHLIMLGKQRTNLNLSNMSTVNEASIMPPLNEETVLMDSIRHLVKDVQNEPSLAKLLEKINEFVIKTGSSDKLDSLKEAYGNAQQLQEKGRELAARREISNALSEIEKSIASPNKNTDQAFLSQAEQYVMNEAVQSLKLDSQNVMVTEITKRLSQMAIDFKKLKQDLSKNLDNVSRMIEGKNVLAQSNVKQILESTINKLDNTILKGDYLLYTDMSTEKELLSASSQLAEAKRLLAKGNVIESNKLVKEVKANLENIIFKPSDVKVKHYVSEKLGLDSLTSAKPLTSTLEQVIQPFSNHESSSRQLYEAFRKLGFMHENEAGFLLSSNSNAQQQNENVKATLLKMMKNEDMKPQMLQQVEQAVNSITGQQLLNKQDSSSTQNSFFQLPYLMENQVENIKIFVNSRKDGDKMDWENCSIYFVLETKKLGDIGVLLSSSEKNVSLTFKSNKENLDEKVADLTEITKERFKEIGYNLNAMGVKPLKEERENSNTNEIEKSQAISTPTFTEKGYDFSI